MFVMPPKHRPLHPSGDGRFSAAESRRRAFGGGTTRRGAAPATPPPCDTLTPRPSAIDAATGGGVAASFLLRDACPHASPARLPRVGPEGQVSGGNERRSARRVWRVARRTDTTGTFEHRASGCVRGAWSRDRARGRLRSFIRPLRAAPLLTGHLTPRPTHETPHRAGKWPLRSSRDRGSYDRLPLLASERLGLAPGELATVHGL